MRQHPAPQWMPHVTLCYSTRVQPAQPIIATSGKTLPSCRVAIDTLTLVVQQGAEWLWNWSPVGAVSLPGSSPACLSDKARGTYRTTALARLGDVRLMACLGIRDDLLAGRFVPPSEATIRRVLEAVDASALEAAVGSWLAARLAAADRPARRSRGTRRAQAHYILVVKKNQPSLYAQLESLPWRHIPVGHRQHGRGHGREEYRTLQAVTVAAGLAFPHTAQAIRVTRRTRPFSGGPLPRPGRHPGPGHPRDQPGMISIRGPSRGWWPGGRAR
jgi:hypothetical protein